VAESSIFRLFILGQLDFNNKAAQTLTTLAEYGTARKLCRVSIDTNKAQALAQRARDLRAYMIDGADPIFDEPALVALGDELFDLIIRDEVSTLLSKAPAAMGFKPLPLEIVVEDSTIAGWPWEFLYDRPNKRYLCLEYFPISRSSFNLDPLPAPILKTDPVRILFVLGATRRDAEANVAEQLDRHKALFRPLEERGLVEVEYIEAADPRNIISAFAARGPFDILHFFGHAGYDATRQEGYLRLDKEFDLRLMPALNHLTGIPTQGKNLIIVADVKGVLHFRIFDRDGKAIVDTDETKLAKQAQQIQEFGQQLQSLWPLPEVTGSEKDRVIADVTSIIGNIKGMESFRYYANRLAGLLLGKSVRLVFLNACETAKGAEDCDPARSALAAAILGRGIPAVIATQFLMPDTSAHFFSAHIYEALASGASLVQAMRDARQVMDYGTMGKPADWGIPVLFAAYPDLVIFPKPKK
jgi:hypothetical protein